MIRAGEIPIRAEEEAVAATAAGEVVVALAGEDAEIAVGLGRAVEMEILARKQAGADDRQDAARPDIAVGGDQIIAVVIIGIVAEARVAAGKGEDHLDIGD